MAKNRISRSEQEEIMIEAYENIAFSFSQIVAYMKNHLRTIKTGMGIINEYDMEEVLKQLEDITSVQRKFC